MLNGAAVVDAALVAAVPDERAPRGDEDHEARPRHHITEQGQSRQKGAGSRSLAEHPEVRQR